MKKILAVSAIIALVACGSDNGPTATRPHFASNITAAACGSAGKFQATATWDVTGDWKAIFVALHAPKDSSLHVTGAATATSGCSFPAGDRIYAILFPLTVQADADLTQTIVLPGVFVPAP
jgi:hypothetical protein